MIDFFHATVYTPLYNLLIGLLDLGSWVDLGVAVIVLTLIVKTLLFPLARKASHTQQAMKELEEPMKEIREKYKDNKEEQGRKLLELYREKGVNPFSGFLIILIQAPIIISLYYMFARGGLPEVNTELLYSFVPTPENVNMWFLGFVDMAGRSLPLALLTGITQYIQVHLTLPPPAPRSASASFQEDFARSMQVQMKYVLPVMIAGFAYVTNAAVALYWITSNMFAIGQELHVKRERAAKND